MAVSSWFRKMLRVSAEKKKAEAEQALEDEKKRITENIQAARQKMHEEIVKNAKLGDMTISLTIPRIDGEEYAFDYEIAAAKFLLPDKEFASHLSTSYSFDLFKTVFEEQINDAYLDAHLDLQNGTVYYVASTGTAIRKVTDQNSFEVALNDLHLTRLKDIIIPFLFTPQTPEAKNTRLPVVIPSPEFGIAGPTSPKEANPWEETPTSPRSLEPQAIKDEALMSGGRNSTVTEPPQSPTALSSYSTDDKPKAKLSLSGVGSQIKKKLTGRETPAEKRERLKTLWVVDETIVFQKGDDNEDEEVEISKFADVEKDDDDDGVESETDEDDGEGISQEDRAIIKLKGLLDLPELGQLQVHPEDPTPADDGKLKWADCCKMFGIDPEKTGSDELVTIAGLKTKIYQYQAFGVFWQMVASRSVGGGFVADDMGLGKTLSFLAYIVIERQLSVLWQEVRKSRTAQDGLHLPDDEKSQSMQCPAVRKPGWIACPCAFLNITAHMPPKSGLRMACVPTLLVRSWWEQWKTHVDTDVADLSLNIIVDHKGAFDNKTSLADQLSRSDAGRFKARGPAERTKQKGGMAHDTPKKFHDGMLILTTKLSFPDLAAKFSYDGQVQDERTGQWKKGKRQSLIFGIAMVDECHEDLSRNTGGNKILLDLPKSNEPYLWGYSGTPISQSPRSLEGILWAIEKHLTAYNKSHSNYPQYSWATLNKIALAFNDQKDLKIADNDGIDKVLETFKPFLHAFVLRRDQNTKWFGHPLIKLKPHLHQDVKLKKINPTYTPQDIADFEASFQFEKDELLSKLQEKYDTDPGSRRSNTRPTQLAFNTLCAKSWRSSLLATFPWLLHLGSAEDDTKMALTDTEALLLRVSTQKEKDNGYSKHLRNIGEASPKALWLYEFLHILNSQKDVNGDEQKLIVITQFPQVAFILKLFFQANFSDKKDRIGLVTGRMTVKEKSEIINSFNFAASKDNPKNKGTSKQDIQVLIGTTRLLGVGLQLTRACNIVLMEPDHHFVRELQGYARVHRIGQRNPISYSYRLIEESSEIEQRVLKRQADRKETTGKRVAAEEVEKLIPAGKVGAEAEEPIGVSTQVPET